MSSAPFPLFARVILAPICGCAYWWPATLSCLTRKSKYPNRAAKTNDAGHQRFAVDGAVTEAVEITDNRSPLFEIARVLVRFDHVASVIVNAHHGIMHSEYQISGHVANITKVAAT